ncbi:hypothetical protein SAMN05519104_7649 [Rhizobiales bacterium GAS188]|nr:hypothetical protein SAMN05519104_7649 [Rhizobiales bacterium GAS188]
MTDKKSTTQLAHEAQANKAFAKTKAEDQRKGVVFAEEAKRTASNAAKTAKLRALREASEVAAESEPKGAKQRH